MLVVFPVDGTHVSHEHMKSKVVGSFLGANTLIAVMMTDVCRCEDRELTKSSVLR